MAAPRSRDDKRREAYMLKQLQHLSVWQGSLVHKGISQFLVPTLRRNRLINEKTLIERTVAMAERQLKFSKSLTYHLLREQPKNSLGDDFCALFEHEYGISYLSEDVENVYQGISQCFQNLFSQSRFIRYLQGRPWYGSEFALQFKFNEATVTARLDVLFFRQGRQPTIIDWKVTKSEVSDYSRQALVYAWVVLHSSAWQGVHPEEIEIYEVNLAKNQIKLHPVTKDRLNKIEDFVFRSIIEIQALRGNSSYCLEHLEDYEFARSPKACQNCNFQRLCKESTS